jgi:hypothetical protein
VFNATSAEKTQFDLPFQYNGQLISASFKYNYSEKAQETFGKKNGYQFLWKEGEASVKDTIAQFTFLNNRTYYTISSLIEGTASLFLHEQVPTIQTSTYAGSRHLLCARMDQVNHS